MRTLRWSFAWKMHLSLVCTLACHGVLAANPVRELAGLQSVSFWEATDGIYTHTLATDGDPMSERRPDPLASGNLDFGGAATEYYDVFYSNAEGEPGLDGEFITVECVTQFQAPYGGGLNICAVALNFSDGSRQLASVVSSYAALGDNAHPEKAPHAVDGDFGTCTEMGNTAGTTSRLRLTVGFGQQPPPGTHGLVAHYRLDGDAQDSSSNGYHGTVVGATPVAGVRGEPGGAMAFDGASYIEIPSVPLLQELTMMAWFRLPPEQEPLPDVAMTIVGADGSYKIYILPDLTLCGNSKAGSVPSGAWTGGPSASDRLCRGRWHHVAWTRALDGRQSLYLDGQLADEGLFDPGTIPEGYGEFIGLDRMHNGTLRYFFHGEIDDVRFYAEPLGMQTIVDIWETTAPPRIPGLVARYPLDGNANDVSGNGYHGTVYDATPTFDRQGAPNSAYSLTATPDRVDISCLPRMQQFTFASWFRARGPGAIIGFDGMYALVADSTRLRGTTKAGSTVGGTWTEGPSTSHSVLDNRWHHAVWSRALNGNQELYLDGQLVSSGSYNAGVIPNSTLGGFLGVYRMIGGMISARFDGEVDDVHVFNRPLTPDEARSLWDGPPPESVLAQLRIAGSPVEAGTPSPLTYGEYTVRRGTVITNTVPDAVQDGVDTRHVSAGWAGTGSVPAAGSAQTAIFELQTNSVLTWLWNTEFRFTACAQPGGSVAPTNGWYASGTQVTLTATPSNGFEFVRWIGTLPGGESTDNPLLISMNQPHEIAAVFRAEDTVFANHWDDDGYYFPGDNVIQCRFYLQRPEDLLSLVWRPILPAGWTLVSAQGDGDPQIFGGEIVFSRHALRNPITFTYTVCVPTGSTEPSPVAGEASYMLNGMANPADIRTAPDPLVLSLYPFAYHTADYRDARWLIDAVELSRVLAYWRAGWYRPNAEGFDGYAPSTTVYDGATNARHRADFSHPYWKINAPEANRVLAYWRAGGYRIDPAGLDGFAPLVHTTKQSATQHAALNSGTPLRVAPFTSDTPTYDPGTLLEISLSISFESNLLALCVKPELPTGWTLVSASAPGNPEVSGGEILWTGALPTSPVTALCAVRVPVWSVGNKTVAGQVDAFVGEGANATNVPIPQSVLTMLPTDEDDDRLPDEWEKFYSAGSTNLNPLDDNDRDGMNNRAEWLAGTDPLSAASVFAVTAITISPEGAVNIEWSSEIDRAYGVVTAPAADGLYQSVADGIEATPPGNALSNLGQAEDAVFIRVVLESPAVP